MVGAFVGRNRELGILRSAVHEAAAGQGRLILLSGEPGIGKTRLSEEIAAEAERSGTRVLRGRCYEGEGAPAFWPWVQILRAGIRDLAPDVWRTTLRSAAELALLVPAIREQVPDLPSPGPLESAEARFRLFDGNARRPRGAR